MERKNAWKSYTDADIAALEAFSADYRAFLDAGKTERECVAESVRIAGARPVEEAIVTAGGVDVREVDPRTMESKLVKGLYFAGEVLDLDAYTGGFNLQIAWSTAYAAAMAAGKE